MTYVAIDTGPLVALVNRRDSHHDWAKQVLSTIRTPIFTCEPVLSEACYLLRATVGGPEAVLGLVAREAVKVDFSVAIEIEPVLALMRRFKNVPMSLADACLVRMTEIEPHSEVLTLDSDFSSYRRNRRQVVPTISPGPRHGS